jgi:hypothetical protein
MDEAAPLGAIPVGRARYTFHRSVGKFAKNRFTFTELNVKGSRMTLFESVKTCFFKYANFSGEASRSELWWFTLFTLLTIIGAALISPKLGLIVILALLIPNISVTTRRLHDLGHSGWWQLIFFLPGLGYLILALYLMRKGVSDGEYEY